TLPDIFALARDGWECFDRHRVDWIESFLASDGRRMVCHFVAPDAESARLAFRQSGSAPVKLWPGRLHVASADSQANILVEREFDTPAVFDDLQSVENAASTCLENHRVTFERTFFSTDRLHMLCLYRAPDAESVRVAQRQAGMPVKRVWQFRRVTPADMAVE